MQIKNGLIDRSIINFDIDGYFTEVKNKKTDRDIELERRQREFIRKVRIRQNEQKLPFEKDKPIDIKVLFD